MENIEEIKDDMLEKDIFLDKFSTDEFMLEFESTKFDEDTYFVNMTYDVKMPMQYSDSAIEKVYTEGIVAEDKLQIEYILLKQRKKMRAAIRRTIRTMRNAHAQKRNRKW